MMSQRFPRSRLLITIVLIATAGCATTQPVKQVTGLDSIEPEARILLMTPDIKVYTLTAGGVPELNPDNTRLARANFVEAAQRHTKGKRTHLKVMEADLSTRDPELARYERLHGAVAQAIDQHYYNEAWKLPSKGSSFDWSLGPGVATLGERYQADYALFVTYVDMSGSGGRWALSIAAALVGVAIPTGGQFGYASLVDLRTGRIVWFNESFATDVGAGDLKTPSGADAIVKNLLDAMPGA